MNARIGWMVVGSLVLVVGCAPRMPQGSKVPFGTAVGATGRDAPFEVLRFTPGGPDAQVTGSSIARHPSGDVVIAGFFTTTADVGLGPARLEQGGLTAFVGRYAPSGTPRWVRWTRADTSGETLPRVAVDGRGDVYFLASTLPTLRPFGDHEGCKDGATCVVGPTLHAVSTDGDVRWSKMLPPAMHPSFVATNAAGEPTIAGRFVGARRANASGPEGERDMFAARYDRATGERRWFTRGRTPTFALPAGLAVGPDGDAYVAGDMDRALDVDGKRLRADGTAVGWIVRLGNADGVARWSQKLGVADERARPLALVADPRGSIVAVLRRERAGEDLVSVATVDVRDGAVRDDVVVATTSSKLFGAVSADAAADGSLVLSTSLLANDTPATRVLGLAPDRRVAWRRDLHVGPAAKAGWHVTGVAVAAASTGEAIVAGSFAGRADFGRAVADGPWGKKTRRCRTEDADDDDCPVEWAANAMFVARVGR